MGESVRALSSHRSRTHPADAGSRLPQPHTQIHFYRTRAAAVFNQWSKWEERDKEPLRQVLE